MTHRWHRLQTRFGMVAFSDLITVLSVLETVHD